MSKKLLFISHDATRTGAPILLLNLAEALSNEPDKYQVRFLIKKGPFDLLERFKGKYLTYLGVKNKRQPGGILKRVVNRLNKEQFSEQDIKRSLKDIDVVISNTITNGDILPLICKYFNGPVLSYIHELEVGVKRFTGPKEVKQLIQHSSHFLVPSLAVKNFLQEVYAIPSNKISLLDYYIPNRSVTEHQNQGRANKTSSKTFYVGSAGTTDWRKGPDIFIQVAHAVFKKFSGADIHFVWKGAPQQGLALQQLQYDIEKAGLKEHITFASASDEMASFYNSLDLFLLTSREDPYPLVVLEAADLYVPTVCFSKAGGSPEFIEKSKGGTCVPYLDIDAMADAVLDYYKHEDKKKLAGGLAHETLHATHQNSQYILQQFESILIQANA